MSNVWCFCMWPFCSERHVSSVAWQCDYSCPFIPYMHFNSHADAVMHRRQDNAHIYGIISFYICLSYTHFSLWHYYSFARFHCRRCWPSLDAQTSNVNLLSTLCELNYFIWEVPTFVDGYVSWWTDMIYGCQPVRLLFMNVQKWCVLDCDDHNWTQTGPLMLMAWVATMTNITLYCY